MLRNLIGWFSAHSGKPVPRLSPEKHMQQEFESLIGVGDGNEVAQVRCLLMEHFIAKSMSRDSVILLRAWRSTEVYGRKLLQGQLI